MVRIGRLIWPLPVGTSRQIATLDLASAPKGASSLVCHVCRPLPVSSRRRITDAVISPRASLPTASLIVVVEDMDTTTMRLISRPTARISLSALGDPIASCTRRLTLSRDAGRQVARLGPAAPPEGQTIVGA